MSMTIKDYTKPKVDSGTQGHEDTLTPEQQAIIEAASKDGQESVPEPEPNPYEISRKTISLPQFTLDLIDKLNADGIPADLSAHIRAALHEYASLSVFAQQRLLQQTRVPNNAGRRKGK